MSNLQLYIAVGLPIIAIITSLVISLAQISGIREEIREIRQNIREIRSDLRLLTGRCTS